MLYSQVKLSEIDLVRSPQMLREMQKHMTDRIATEVANSLKFDVSRDPSRQEYIMSATCNTPDGSTSASNMTQELLGQLGGMFSGGVNYQSPYAGPQPSQKTYKPPEKTWKQLLRKEVSDWLKLDVN